ncbi:hypothetical protein [Kitasatospora viridis]|uniref:Uncharacterized protein n=1 Tax=Kitasatospora viridis TaxID=281105 RepID=A0A561UAL0_9ACTN|nr:hypothetical protein [Kitasatospora viridis]TWF96394.1 hypothetical protein FHX73_11159 [Kitasatospora viridis]
MSTALLRRGARSAAVTALAVATAMGATGVARADAPGHEGFVVNVKLSTSGVVQAPDEHAGGTVTFKIATDDPNGRELQMIRPHQGVTMDQVLQDLAVAVGPDPTAAAAAIVKVRDEAEALGGGLARPGNDAILTEDIKAGPVYLLDFTAFLANPGSPPPVKELDLCEDAGFHLPHFPHSIVIQHETSNGPRFQTEAVDDANGGIFVHNAADELHEMQIQPVAPGTTDDQVQAYFDALLNNTPPPPPPFTGVPVGLSVISPGHDAVIHIDKLPPGDYVLLCFVPDDQTGLPHAFEGMHKVVHLH